jgi:hypothetical protein
MPTSSQHERSPNEVLADLVVAKLREEGVILDDKKEEITAKIVAGTASRDDWKLWIEMAQSKQSKDKDNDTH